MEVIGLDSNDMQQQVWFAFCGVCVIFFILSPLAGRVVHRFSRRLLPEQDIFALLATAFVVFALSFAVMFGLLRQFVTGLEMLPALGISLIVALLVTGVTAAFVQYTIRRGAARIDPHASEFGVWGEDARKRTKSLRRKR